jgi:hypothetical protein
MKRFLLFAYAPFEANGGWNDFVSSYDDKDEAIRDAAAAAEKDRYAGLWHVVDAQSWSIVADGLGDAGKLNRAKGQRRAGNPASARRRPGAGGKTE